MKFFYYSNIKIKFLKFSLKALLIVNIKVIAKNVGKLY